MASLYPAGLDELNAGVGAPNDPLSAPSHPAHHTALADAVEAVQTELGTDPSGAAATVKARLDGLDTTVSGKAASSHSHAQGDVTGLVTDLAGKIPASLVDAKGDIIAATADNTVARLGVGTNGHVLTADSAQATGLKWAAAGGGGPISSPCLARSGHYYMSIFGAVPLTTVSINGYDRVFYVPIIFDNTTTVNNIGIYLNVVGTAGAGSATCALGIYASSADHQPTSRIVSAGTLDLTATIGSRFIAISQSLTARTLYWLAFTHGLQGTAPQMRGPTYASQFGMPLLGAHNLDSFNNSITAQWNRGTYGWIETRTYDGTLPSSAGTLSALRVFDLNIPAVCVSLS